MPNYLSWNTKLTNKESKNNFQGTKKHEKKSEDPIIAIF